MKPYKVNEKDERILEILTANAQTTQEDIAKQVDLSVAEVQKIIKKLEKDRIIISYRAQVNWQRIRQHDVRALIEVKVTPERKVGFDAVAESIYRFNEVSSVYLLSGGYDLLVQVEGENLKEVAQFVSEKLATIKGVQSTVSHFMLKKYKEHGAILDEISKTNRLPVSP